MTKKIVKKIAGVSYDQWLEKKRKEPSPIRELKKYSNQLIAFLDVLGIKDLINHHRDGNEHVAIDKIEKIRKIVKTSSDIVKRSEDIDYLHISDSFVYVCNPKTIIRLIELLSTIQMRIITECQLLLRGAITVGDAIVREEATYIVGPAYIQAFQLQENDAIYPRIIVDTSVTDAIKKSGESIDKYLFRDVDKEYFIDYLKIYMQKELLSKQKIKVLLRREDVYNWLKDSFRDHYRKEEHNISQKYGWTIQYYKKLEVWENGR